jgi:hypothetical protein
VKGRVIAAKTHKGARRAGELMNLGNERAVKWTEKGPGATWDIRCKA